MALEDDPWVRRPSSIPQIHALGLITYRWNACEQFVPLLFWQISQIDWSMARLITHDMQTPSICDKIIEMLDQRAIAFDTETEEAIRYGMDLFSANRINRNQLTHFLPVAVKQGDAPLTLLRNKGPRYPTDALDADLASLRRVADEIRACSSYLHSIHVRLFHSLAVDEREPLPDRPPIPKRYWTPAQPSQTAPPAPLPTSRQ